MIVDTNILIDYLKGKHKAVRFISELHSVKTSVVVTSELFSGVSNKVEMRMLKEFLTFVEQVEVSKTIAEEAGLLRKKYFKSHGIEIPDAIIAATANYLQEPIASLNKKHFSVLTNRLIIPY